MSAVHVLCVDSKLPHMQSLPLVIIVLCKSCMRSANLKHACLKSVCLLQTDRPVCCSAHDCMVYALPEVCNLATRLDTQKIDCREDAVRLGLFIGGFTGSYHLISGALKKWQGSLPPPQNCMAAGTAAGAATCPPASYCVLPCRNMHVCRVNQNTSRWSVQAAMPTDIIHTYDVRCSCFCTTCMRCTSPGYAARRIATT